MSLRPEPIGPVPEETARVARAAFPRGNPWLRLRDELGTIYTDETFAPLFPTHGRPAEAPWRLALVTVLQFAEACRIGRRPTPFVPGSIGSTCWAWPSTTPASMSRCSASSALG